MEDVLARFMWPIIAVIVLIAFYTLVKGMAAFYIKVPPNMAVWRTER